MTTQLTTPEMRAIDAFIDTCDTWRVQLEAILDDKKFNSVADDILQEMLRSGTPESDAQGRSDSVVRNIAATRIEIQETRAYLKYVQVALQNSLRAMMRSRQAAAEAASFVIN